MNFDRIALWFVVRPPGGGLDTVYNSRQERNFPVITCLNLACFHCLLFPTPFTYFLSWRRPHCRQLFTEIYLLFILEVSGLSHWVNCSLTVPRFPLIFISQAQHRKALLASCTSQLARLLCFTLALGDVGRITSSAWGPRVQSGRAKNFIAPSPES